MRSIQTLLLTWLFFGTVLWAVNISTEATPDTTERNITRVEASSKVFGYHLFNGSFSENRQFRYNPNYLVNIGDTVNLKLWGAFDLDTQLSVDSQGHIFIPKVGTVSVIGIRNDQLSKSIQASVKEVYKTNVFVYADLANYQPVSLFVTGAVNRPGLYEGLSSDSIIQFIDKASGIDTESGSFRDIKVLRQNKLVKQVDLYEFLIFGTLELFQFRMGDVIVVESIKRYIEVTGDVKRPYRYELLKPSISLAGLQKTVLPNPTATNVVITRWDKDNVQSVRIHDMATNSKLRVNSGESIRFIPDHTAQNIEIEISGEHANIHNLVVAKGTSLAEVFSTLRMSALSDPEAFQIFRKSIATQQKKLISAQLNDLETKTLTTGSVTTEEALIRKQEAALVLNFIERARQVEPKGQVIINKDTDLSQVFLEDGDNIYIPKKSHMVIVQGEVMLPGAQTYVSDMSFDEYIASCGGYSFRADDENVIIIQKNGKVINYDPSSYMGDDYAVQPGDSILVVGKVDSKFLQVVKDITQIVYQIAVGAAVVINTNY